jgi:hypothetical protein
MINMLALPGFFFQKPGYINKHFETNNENMHYNTHI